jgi:hypothetical protein
MPKPKNDISRQRCQRCVDGQGSSQRGNVADLVVAKAEGPFNAVVIKAQKESR